jgi:hypothetical protein
MRRIAVRAVRQRVLPARSGTHTTLGEGADTGSRR